MAKKQYLDVGIVKQIFRYPVKSLAGGAVEESRIGWHGVEGDRRFAFLKMNSKSGFPWFTARDNPQLLQYRPYFVDAANIRKSAIYVATPSGADLPLSSPELLAEINGLSRQPVHLIQNWGGNFDAMDISLISTASIQAISEQIDEPLTVQRFRPNILVEVFDERPFPEDRWLKNLLVFGERGDSAHIRNHRKTLRCMVVNVDLDQCQQNPAVLRHIVQTRRNCLGVYGSTERPGSVQVGDVIRMVKA